MISKIKKPLEIVQGITTKRMIKQFVEKFDFVYFGKVDHRDDEHKLVKGMTATAEHSDNHYAIGSFRGHDIIIVERTNALKFPGKEDQEYRWLILQVDLRKDDLPHMFLDAHHHEEVFYANLFIKFANLEDASRIFMHHDETFSKHFKIFTPPDFFEDVSDVLVPEITAMLGHHFKQFDYEIDEDRLLVYASNVQITQRLIREMMRVGLWLADHINSTKVKEPVKDK